MLNFRKGLLKAVGTRRGDAKIKKYAEDFLRETLKRIRESDDKDISKLKEIKFLCSETSITVCLSLKMQGIFVCESYGHLSKKVFGEIKRKLKFEGLINDESEDDFSIMVP